MLKEKEILFLLRKLMQKELLLILLMLRGISIQMKEENLIDLSLLLKVMEEFLVTLF